MNREEAENYIYESYGRAVPYLDYNAPDSVKRHPELTRKILESFPHVCCAAVTGSKGKGSVCSMIAAIMAEKVRTGMFTSPHILSFNERFAVDGETITDEEFTDCVTRVKELFDQLCPGQEKTDARGVYISPIGIQAAVALAFFGDRRTEFNVFECGKGARYDDVNNIPHEYAVITPIFEEHTRELGATVREIAIDKACLIKKGMRCAYTAAQADEVMEVLEKRATECKVPLKVYGRDFAAENIVCTKDGMRFDVAVGEMRYDRLRLNLLGKFQAENAALALAVCTDVCSDRANAGYTDMCDDLQRAGHENAIVGTLKIEEVRHALRGVMRPGRMEIVCRDPLMILDAAINRKNCEALPDVLKTLGIKSVVSVIAVPDDKDFEGVALAVKDISSRIILTKSGNPHYVFTEKQKDALKKLGIENVSRFTDPREAVREAAAGIKKEGSAILLLGTTSFVGEIKKMMTEDQSFAGDDGVRT